MPYASYGQKLSRNRPKQHLYGRAICKPGEKYASFVSKGAVGGLVDETSERHAKHWWKNNPKPIQVKYCCLSKT